MRLSEHPNITVRFSGEIENPLRVWRAMRVTPIKLMSAVCGATIEPYQIAVLYTPSRQNPSMKFAGKIVYGKKFRKTMIAKSNHKYFLYVKTFKYTNL